MAKRYFTEEEVKEAIKTGEVLRCDSQCDQSIERITSIVKFNEKFYRLTWGRLQLILKNVYSSQYAEEVKENIRYIKTTQWINVTAEEPYIFRQKIKHIKEYNPNYGDDRICVCGHPYYRHFDWYDNMFPCGCKYCECFEFEEADTNEATD